MISTVALCQSDCILSTATVSKGLQQKVHLSVLVGLVRFVLFFPVIFLSVVTRLIIFQGGTGFVGLNHVFI